jgi:6-pyruvoyltetrahydropterin/6-carboxytetrahydropterin synthase
MTCTRRLTFAAGHRVWGHEGKCAHPHGHNYIAEITVSASLDPLGRVIDFGVVKTVVGGWIDQNWDHGFLVNEDDQELLECFEIYPAWRVFIMPGNPTAENIAQTLLRVSTELLTPLHVTVTRVRIHETENCYADAV